MQCKLIAIRVIFSLIIRNLIRISSRVLKYVKMSLIPKYLENKEWMLMQSQINTVRNAGDFIIHRTRPHLILFEIKLR